MIDGSGSREAALKGRARLPNLVPGVVLAGVVAIASTGGAALLARVLPITAMVVALFIGIALNPVASRPVFKTGIGFCVRTVLRCGVALLGLRIAISDITSLGMETVVIVVVSMLITIASGFVFARAFGQKPGYGALIGIGTAICGASAALATSMVVPDYHGKQADVVFSVVALNSFATVAMVLYPPLCMWLGFDHQTTGIMLGATVHDVAQVVGAAYPVSETAGNTAVVVKLFRVFLLFPIVLATGWWFNRGAALGEGVKVPVPIFALVFIVLVVVNSFILNVAALAPSYVAVKPLFVDISNWALLVAIAALGLSTSVSVIASLGWRHLATVSASTLVILVLVVSALSLRAAG
ncbi:MAG TPA: putative sulfate exporter family transporter [Micropepsaceae bacterium]|nr:putative sulfate exporter family transporter [Micropepsaceae bacterium]